MKITIKGFFGKSLTVLKWFFWIVCAVFLFFAGKLYFLVPFILAIACGLLLKKYVRRVPTPLIPAVCVLLGSVFMLTKMHLMQGAYILFIIDGVIPGLLMFWLLLKPTLPRAVLLSACLVLVFMADFALFNSFDHSGGQVNKFGFEQMLIKLFALGFLVSGMARVRKAQKNEKAEQGGS